MPPPVHDGQRPINWAEKILAVTPLKPTLNDLCQEYVLVQAWKKTAAYVRYHNWFSDTLELDQIAANLPDFISGISRGLASGEIRASQPLRIVPAPKSQPWRISSSGKWAPLNATTTASKIRPLAHVSLRDQVIATAMMLCLADRAETAQRDPRIPLDSEEIGSITSYGNRLFCDESRGVLRHRWGSSKLYRGFYQDYQTFLARPEAIAERSMSPGSKILVLQSDLRQFYDRVSHSLFCDGIDRLRETGDDEIFFDLVKGFFKWRWSESDSDEVQIYAKNSGLKDFTQIVLPQGLVASGFFANVTLLGFDQSLRRNLNRDVSSLGLKLLDASRYVDDLRLVLEAGEDVDLSEAETELLGWLNLCLSSEAPGLVAAPDKTRASVFRGDERPLVQQSRRMSRIQAAVSGGFDALAGGEILDAVLGLVRTQQRLSQGDEKSRPFLPVPDVRDSTVDRFAAGRFRSTFRSLRPLLAGDDESDPIGIDTGSSEFRSARTKSELDDEGRAFALGLIDKWVEDPSNVRLLRIGLDLWPAADVLERILALLRPFTEKGGLRKAPRRVAWYCLSEIFRAGATETGFVSDRESLPDRVDLKKYRQVLSEEARRIASQTAVKIPWYLRQQALLFLAANMPREQWTLRAGKNPETKHYRQMIRFLQGEQSGLGTTDYSTLAILARRSFTNRGSATALAHKGLTPARLNRIAGLDPVFGREIVEDYPKVRVWLTPRLSVDLGFNNPRSDERSITLAEVVLNGSTKEYLRNEISLLSFASAFLRNDTPNHIDVIAPNDVKISISNAEARLKIVDGIEISSSRQFSGASIYDAPEWASSDDIWRFQLGYLLRFILSAKVDFTQIVRAPHWKEEVAIYRPAESHWYQRIYGLFNGHAAFGDDWLPITDWTERLLFGLLRWPGCPTSDGDLSVVGTRLETAEAVEARLEALHKLQGTSVAVMPIRLPRAHLTNNIRPLRACVVQTVIPGLASDFDIEDLTLSRASTRARHRRHLSAALAAVERSLALRETHKGREGRLDWLILPELAVHPDDVATHLIPFARAHKTIILAGLTYQRIEPDRPLVNSAVWVIPTQDQNRGLQVLIRRQGKWNLAPLEQPFNVGEERIRPFRPCQWLVGYEWSNDSLKRPLWLTAAICYDATDICLAADLKNISDVFAVPALNKDVATFDQMALALHYHMFQMVIVANNGLFGGSNAYAPYRSTFERQVFHMHGQPQASIAFLEIDDIESFIDRKNGAGPEGLPSAPAPNQPYLFKSPPAGS